MDVTGTIVGFRAPSYAQGMTVAGHHLHFISSEHTQGGHVLDFTLGLFARSGGLRRVTGWGVFLR